MLTFRTVAAFPKLVIALGAFVLTACDTTSPGPSATIRFSSPAVAGSSSATPAGLEIIGTNGTLLISDIKVVVDEFELEPVDASDCDDDLPGSADGCEGFESNLFAADVPLGAGAVTIANDQIPAGSYDELEFEVKDLFVDMEDPDDVARAARIAEVLAQLRAVHADWPEGASMRIAGTFTPTGGAPVPFVVYFDAEIEVELALAAPLVIDESSTGATVALRPDLWFKLSDGSVLDLSEFDYSATAALLEFEAEFEGGVEIEIDD